MALRNSAELHMQGVLDNGQAGHFGHAQINGTTLFPEWEKCGDLSELYEELRLLCPEPEAPAKIVNNNKANTINNYFAKVEKAA